MKPSILQVCSLFCLVATASAPAARAGDVGVVVKHGDLRVVGSDSDDGLVIEQTGPTAFRVQPSPGTTINGSASFAEFEDVDRDVKIALGEGANTLTIQNATLPRDLSVRAGDGIDKVTLSVVTVKRHARFALGAGNNEPTLTSVVVKGRLSLSGGDDIDLVKLTSTHVFGSFSARLGTTLVNASYFDTCEFEGPFTLVCGSANDVVNIYQSTLHRDCALRLGNGANIAVLANSDYLGDVHEVCGPQNPGYNTMAMLNGAHFHRDLRLDFGGTGTTINAYLMRVDRDWIVTGAKNGGNDGWLVGDDVVGRDLRWSAGGGTNVLNLGGMQIGRDLTIAAGPGDDLVNLDDVTGVRSARVALGRGANTIHVTTAFDARRFAIMTGADADVLDVKAVATLADFRLLLGGGDNALALDALAIGHDLFVKTGDGDDTITLANSTVSGKTKFSHGAGADTVP